MSRDRFKAITSCLHLSDPAQDELMEQARVQDGFDALHRVRPLMELIRNRCMAVYHPRQNISVDERMVGTKFLQCISNKPKKWGQKFFVLADVCGYFVDFRLYAGTGSEVSGKDQAFNVVSSLVNKEYLGSGYVVYCDNFYTRPRLFTHLVQQGFGACGTYRAGRIGVPKTEVNALHKKSPCGSIRWIRDGELLFVKWMDTRVSMCTTVHPVHNGETVRRWRKNGAGRYERVLIPRPTAVQEYNRFMGGVNTSDQMLGTHSVHRKTKRWYMTVFQHMVDIAVTNSYIISKQLAATRGERAPTRQQFQEELCAQLFKVPVDYQPPEPEPVEQQSFSHFPVPVAEVQDVTQRATKGRRKCACCRRSTPWQCKVGLCLQLDRNCFRLYHKGPSAEV